MKTVLHLQKSPSGIFHTQPTFSTKEKIAYQLQKSSKQVIDFAKFSYLAVVMVLLLCAVVELKHIYNIDIFPGIDTPIDNAYFAGKDQIDGNIL